AQDTGSPNQGTAGTIAGWNDINRGDGAIAAVDTLYTAGQTIQYTSGSFLTTFRRRTFNSSNQLLESVGLSDFGNRLLVNGTGQTIYQYDQSGGLSNLEFVNPYVTNAVAGGRLLIGTYDKVFESTDRED